MPNPAAADPVVSNDCFTLNGARQLDGSEAQDLAIVDGHIAKRAFRGPVLDLSGLYIAPGYIDLQINGGWGIDLQQDPTKLWELGERLVQVGVTSFCPTLTSDGTANLGAALDALSARPVDYLGAEVCGWHLEGPWLNVGRKGAHGADAVCAIGEGIADGAFTVSDLSSEAGIAIVTLAPELPGAMDAIATLVDAGITVSLGHSEATMEVALQAFEAGATMGTHLFNAMPGLHHRTLSLSTALVLQAPAVGIIADGVHLAPEMLHIAWQLANGRVVVVSDAVAEMGDFSTIDESSSPAAAYTANGTIAGSVIGLDQCVRNLVSFTTATPAEAVNAASGLPAKTIGLLDRGHLATGARADLVVLSESLEVVMAVVGGEIAYDRRQI